MLVRLCDMRQCQPCFDIPHTLAAVQEGKRLVVIGSSFISMELMVAVQKRNLASIDVIGMEEFPFEMVLGKQVGAGLKKVSSVLESLVA